MNTSPVSLSTFDRCVVVEPSVTVSLGVACVYAGDSESDAMSVVSKDSFITCDYNTPGEAGGLLEGGLESARGLSPASASEARLRCQEWQSGRQVNRSS